MHFYSFDIEESTDTAQLVIFVQGIDDNFNVIKDLLALSLLKVQARGIDILQALKNVLQNNRLGLENLTGLATPSMIG